MQGGHGESLHAFWEIWDPKVNDDSGYESEVAVTDGISLGYRLDTLLHTLRTWTAETLSLPIAWAHLEPTVQSFREHKFRRVKQGTETVLQLQKFLRCFPLTVVASAFSFCAEEEFYLLVLPLTFWNVSVTMARYFTYTVCFGLLVGNVMKDVFRLPRPPSPPVWRPSHQAAIDSTSLRDFGFPSTHSMNALTNSCIIFLYLNSVGWLEGDLELPMPSDTVMKLPIKLLATVMVFVYTFMICFSRIYLGAHSPTDIRGGLSLGVILVAVLWRALPGLDEWVLSTELLEVKCLILAITVLLLNPQPRPVTPTFAQNALLVGLLVGTALGTKYYHEMLLGDLQPLLVSKEDGTAIQFLATGSRASSLVPYESSSASLVQVTAAGLWLKESHPVLGGLLRTVCGYILVMILRVIVKKTTVTIISVFGIRLAPVPSPQQEQNQSKANKRENAQKDDLDESKKKTKKEKLPVKPKVVRLFTRDIDIVGTAIVKSVTYASLALAITFIVPFIALITGLSTVPSSD